ncbi:MAG: peptidyl-prolyl cis-trans isomerase [Candidatus Eisenbacteria bacterium]|nr:peptidyl-prolyl cis-trans isomerase [Candidatus Latescibacterota bacterium]MBD3302612.1 peptidyl-prolyl cis-trans isomerase [Candidatus Eisenbacteria bacterium]
MRILLAGLCGALLSGTALASEEAAQSEPAVQSETKEDANPVVLMETSMGNIKLELYPEKAPKTVENFLGYVEDGFYDGTIFHRVIKNFMIQGGGFTPDMDQKQTGDPIPLESQSGLKNVRGSIAMARTANPNSATSQFFINHKDNPNLDYPKPDGNGYAVFGKVIEGMDTVDEIAKVKTTTKGPHGDVPAEPVVIKSAKVVS